ncbi:unnamed protein product [Porites lobata]|uniref:Uncharacterized protein n=1 Tax=Porites lobata TaxID=104759 RepID=A0ABN8PH98_9CNID|nr:unnamed protein product [Porites lobata]
MEWTESHDVALCKEVLVQNAFLARKKNLQRAAIWQKIADELVSLSRPKFKVTLIKRSVQDRLLLIITKHKRRMATERRGSGTSPEISELDKLSENVVEKEKCYEQRRESEVTCSTRKQELDKAKGEEARYTAMKTLLKRKEKERWV